MNLTFFMSVSNSNNSGFVVNEVEYDNNDTFTVLNSMSSSTLSLTKTLYRYVYALAAGTYQIGVDGVTSYLYGIYSDNAENTGDLTASNVTNIDVKETVSSEAVQLKFKGQTVTGNGHVFKIHRNFLAVVAVDFLMQGVYLLRFQCNQEKSVVQGIVVENIGEAGGDDSPEAVVLKRPGGMFAAGAVSEILSGYQDCGALVAGVVKNEFRIGFGSGFVQIAPVVKKVYSETGTGYRLQELFGDDLISINVGGIQGYSQSFVYGKFLHDGLLE